MEVTILGSGTIIPSFRRGAPGLLITEEGWSVLCDSGPGTMTRLLHCGVSPVELDSLVYTHFHPDHTAELAPLLFLYNSVDQRRSKPLQVWGPTGLEQFYAALGELYGSWVEPRGYSLSIREAEGGPFALGPFRVRTREVAHTPQSIAYRFEGPRGETVVCSGDTGYCEAIVGLAREANLLILECSFPEGRGVEGHLTPSEAGRIAREACVKRLALNHFYPACDESDLLDPLRREFQGDAVLTTDLLRLVVHG